MALEATHIRFALDLKEHFNIKDECQYLSGAIYPDSRYVTGIDREVTHPKELFERKKTELSDFEKGWLTHLMCDEIQFAVTVERFPKMASMTEGHERWLYHTVLKILQDMDDLQKFDIKKYLPCLSYIETPNGESREKVGEYNAIFPALYSATVPGSEEYYDMWKKLGIGDALVAELRVRLEKAEHDPVIQNVIPLLYPEMVLRALK